MQTDTYLVRASFLEIYNDDVLDLLSSKGARDKLEVKEHPDKGVYVKDLETRVVKSAADLAALLIEGKRLRKVGATAMNPGSSRSHCIFTITIESFSQVDVGKDGKSHIKSVVSRFARFLFTNSHPLSLTPESAS